VITALSPKENYTDPAVRRRWLINRLAKLVQIGRLIRLFTWDLRSFHLDSKEHK
jgi:hypothetical protein